MVNARGQQQKGQRKAKTRLGNEPKEKEKNTKRKRKQKRRTQIRRKADKDELGGEKEEK